MRFLRFVVTDRHPDSGVSDGVFRAAYRLAESSDVAAGDREALRENLAWFEKNLRTPCRFNRSASKGWYRRRTRGIAWFRDSARECIARMYELSACLERNGYHVRQIREGRIGYVVYEDDLQVVAEPFSDTRVR